MKIDLVYLWVDGNDQNWQSKKSRYSTNNYDKDAVNNCRFFNNDELKYSLRSVEKYAPWINKIFIVTDNQTPYWLNFDNPKIQIVNHDEIIPYEKLPLFNSCAIETRIPFIPDLSEYFLYANDDMLFWDYVNEDFFFNNEKVICRINKKIKKSKTYNHIYGHTINRAHDIIDTKYPLTIPAYFPHHGIDAYRKSLFLDCIKEFKNEFEETLNHRFREYTDMQRMSISYYTMAKGMGIPKNIELNSYEKYIKKLTPESQCYNLTKSSIEKIRNSKSKLMCLNDCRKTTSEDRSKIKALLEEKFPQKSHFEA